MDKNNSIRLLNETLILIDGAYAPSTIRAYKTNFERFICFCEDLSASSLPANSEIVAKYIQKLTISNLKSSSIRLAVASISTIHKLNQLPDPTQLPVAKLELRRMHRTLGRASKQALGITAPIIEKMIQVTKNDLRGLRDRALILLAYDSLCRRSELTSIKLDDIECDDNGLPIHIRIRKSKTDQEGIGKVIRITENTRIAIMSWVNSAKIIDGLLFRGIKNNGVLLLKINSSQINRIYKKIAKQAGLTQEAINNISGHSIRVGATQDLVSKGFSLAEIMNKGRWSKIDTAIRYAENLII